MVLLGWDRKNCRCLCVLCPALSVLLLFCRFYVFLLACSCRERPPRLPNPWAHFPAIQATSLDDARSGSAGKLSGQLNLVIISFAREQQQEVDTGFRRRGKSNPAHNKFRYYELPTMSQENLLYRWWFDAALRSNTTDKDLRSRILTAYVGKHGFKQSLHIANEKRVVAILVDQKGRVYWRADGSYTDQEMPALLALLTANGV